MPVQKVSSPKKKIQVSGKQILKFQFHKQALSHGAKIKAKHHSKIHQLGILHSTNQTTPFLSLFNRIENFNPNDLINWSNTTTQKDFQYFRVRAMRGTIFLIPNANAKLIQKCYPVDSNGFTAEMNSMWNKESDIQDHRDELKKLQNTLISVIKQKGPQSSITIKKHLPTDSPILKPPKHLVLKNKYLAKGETEKEDSGNIIGPLLRWACRQNHLDYGTSGIISHWRKTDQYFSIPSTDPQNTEESKEEKKTVNNREKKTVNDREKKTLNDREKKTANDHPLQLARLYFSWYGPASWNDFLWWASWTSSYMQPWIALLEKELIEVTCNELKERLFMMPEDAKLLENTEDSMPEGVSFLPYEDAFLKGYKETRYRFYNFNTSSPIKNIAETSGGEMRATIVVNGEIVGSFSWENKPQKPLTLNFGADFSKLKKSVEDKNSLLSKALEPFKNFLEASALQANSVHKQPATQKRKIEK